MRPGLKYLAKANCLIGLSLLAALFPVRAGAQASAATAQAELVRALGHSGSIESVAFTPDGKFVLTGSTDGTARLWEKATGLEIRRFEIGSFYMYSAAFSPDGLTVLTASDKIVALWDVATGSELRRFLGHEGQVMSVAFSPDGKTVLTGGWDNSARLWDVNSGAELQRFLGQRLLINSVAFSPDGRTVLTGGRDNTAIAQHWDIATGNELRRFVGHSSDVSSTQFSPDGKTVLTASFDNTVRLWDAETGAELLQFQGHTDRVNGAAFSPDGQSVLTASHDRTVRLWDANTGAEVRRIAGHSHWVESVAFSADGHTMLTGSWDRTARLWDVATGTELQRYAEHSMDAHTVAFSPNGQLMFIAGYQGTARLWNVATGTVLRQFSGQSGQVYAAAFSPDGQSVLTGGTGRTVRVWDVATGTQRRQFAGDGRDVFAMAFSPDGQAVLAGGSDNMAVLWDVNTGAELARFAGHTDKVTSVAFSPDGQTVLTGSWDNTARLWNVATGAELRVYTMHTRGVSTVLFSPDGRFVLTGSWDKTAWLWDAATGAPVRQFAGDILAVFSAAFSADGRLVLIGDYDNAGLWDVATATRLHSFAGHGDNVMSVAFSPDGLFALTGSTDKTARLWDVASGTELAQLVSFTDGTWAVIDAAGRFDASNGGDVVGLHWVAGLEVIKLSQLKGRYYEPGLLAKILGRNDEPIRDVAAFSDVELYPEVTLEAPTVDAPSLQINLLNRGGGIGRVVVAINGKEISADVRGDDFDETAREASIVVDLHNHPYIIPGADNPIEVKVYNTEGYLVSSAVSVSWVVPGIEGAPELWAVIAGVSDYTGEDLDLNFASKDAADFAAALAQGAARLFGADKVHLTLLSTEDNSADPRPTRENLVLALQGLADAKPTDVVLVYLAGHGVALGGQDGDYFFLTQQATGAVLIDPAVRSTTTLSSEELTELLLGIPVARKQVLILDTCGAGRVVERLSQTRTVSSSQTRALDRLSNRTGLFILAGSAADAVSYEASEYGQGLLTYSLLEGMRGASLREDEYLDVSQWFGYAADRVQDMAEDIGGVQRPLVGMPRGTGSFDVARLTEIDRQQIELQQPLPILIRAIFQLDGPPIDPMGLTSRVNAALREVSASSDETLWVFVDTPEYLDGYQVSGRYSVDATTNEVVVNVFLLRENEVVGTKTVTGTAIQVDSLIDQIIQATADLF